MNIAIQFTGMVLEPSNYLVDQIQQFQSRRNLYVGWHGSSTRWLQRSDINHIFDKTLFQTNY